jgi:aspartate kinase
LFLSIYIKKGLSKELSIIFQRLERYLFRISFTREATPKMQDMVATFGERISAVILSRSLAAMGSVSSPLFPEDAGIL